MSKDSEEESDRLRESIDDSTDEASTQVVKQEGAFVVATNKNIVKSEYLIDLNIIVENQGSLNFNSEKYLNTNKGKQLA